MFTALWITGAFLGLGENALYHIAGISHNSQI